MKVAINTRQEPIHTWLHLREARLLQESKINHGRRRGVLQKYDVRNHYIYVELWDDGGWEAFIAPDIHNDIVGTLDALDDIIDTNLEKEEDT